MRTTVGVLVGALLGTVLAVLPGASPASATAGSAGPTWRVVAADPGAPSRPADPRPPRAAFGDRGPKPRAAATPTGAPGAPAAIDTTATSATSISLLWSPPTNPGAAPITGYRMTRLGSAQVVELDADVTTFTWTGLSRSTSYRFTLAAVNARGTGEPAYHWEVAAAPPPDRVWGLSGGWDRVYDYEPGVDDPASEENPIRVRWGAPVLAGGDAPSGYAISVDGVEIGILAGDTVAATITGAPAGTYSIGVAAIDDLGTTGPAAEVVVAVAGAPSNDEFADRIDLGQDPVRYAGSNWAATGEAGDPPPPAVYPDGGDASVWYSWTPPSSGRVEIRTWEGRNAFRDTTLAAYTGTTLGDLVRLAGNDNVDCCHYRSKIRFDVEAGRTYLLAVDGYHGRSWGGTGYFELTWVLYPPVAQTTTTMTGALAGRTVTLTATIGSDGAPAVGWASFYEGGERIGSSEVDADHPSASFTVADATGGGHHYTAAFYPADDVDHDPSLSAGWDTWLPPSATSSSASAQEGFDGTELVVEVSSASGVPTGTVRVHDGAATTAPLGRQRVDETGRAVVEVGELPGGTHHLTGVFVPDDDRYAGSQAAPVTVVKDPTGTSTELVATVSGRQVTLRASVTSYRAAATGLVEVRDRGVLVGSVPASAAGADLVLAGGAAGQHLYQASFTPTDPMVHAGSSSDVIGVSVAPSSTSTVLRSAAPGGRLLATVASSDGVPTGTVELREGAEVVASAPVLDGRATLLPAQAAPGGHRYWATFVSDTEDYLGSASGPVEVAVAVTPAVTSRITIAVPRKARSGSRPTVAVRVRRAGGQATGTVTVRVAGGRRERLALVGGRATVRLRALRPGVTTIIASYAGDATTSGSTARVSIRVPRRR